MSLRPAVLLASALLLVPADFARPADDPVGTTLQQVKSAYRQKKYAEGEEALRHLAELVAAPERAAIRPKVMPAIHFYGAALAYAEKDEDRARASLRKFFELAPDASIDPALYPKSFRIFFDAQRTEAAKAEAAAEPAGPQAIAGGVLPAYAKSDVDTAAIPANNGAADWDQGPVKFLMDSDEQRAFRSLADDDARRSFVNEFWRRRDPDPRTPENEFQIEFYRRVQYADANFSTEAVRGSLSDRGMVFVVLGPPSYVGRATIQPGQDTMDLLRTTETVLVRSPSGQLVSVRVPSNRRPLSPGISAGEMETWYYRRDRVMKGLPYPELQYQFVTKSGYGTAVLQKDPVPLTALRKAATLLRKPHQG